MKTLFVLASVMVVFFLAAPNKVEAQKRKTINRSNQSLKSNIDFLRKSKGIPFNNPQIKKRLQTLLGKERFAFMVRNWNLDGITNKSTNDVLVETGCMSHFCPQTNFIIAVDIANNRFYVGIRDNDRIRTYSERGGNPSSYIQQRIQHWKEYGSA